MLLTPGIPHAGDEACGHGHVAAIAGYSSVDCLLPKGVGATCDLPMSESSMPRHGFAFPKCMQP